LDQSGLANDFSNECNVDVVVEYNNPDPFSNADGFFRMKFAQDALFQRPVDLLETREIHNPYLRQEIS
jgi:uncharacterized protein